MGDWTCYSSPDSGGTLLQRRMAPVGVCPRLLRALAAGRNHHHLFSPRGCHEKSARAVSNARMFAKPFRVTDGDKFRLKNADPGDGLGFKFVAKPRARAKEGPQMGSSSAARFATARSPDSLDGQNKFQQALRQPLS